MSSSICIPNMTLLACKVVEKSLTKKCYGIMEGRTDGRTDGMTDRCKPVYPPLFQSGGIIKNLKKIHVMLDGLCPLAHCPFGHNTMGYSQTCLKGSAQGTGKNWLLKTGRQVTPYYRFISTIIWFKESPKKWLLKAGDPLIQ